MADALILVSRARPWARLDDPADVESVGHAANARAASTRCGAQAHVTARLFKLPRVVRRKCMLTTRSRGFLRTIVLIGFYGVFYLVNEAYAFQKQLVVRRVDAW